MKQFRQLKSVSAIQYRVGWHIAQRNFGKFVKEHATIKDLLVKTVQNDDIHKS